MLRKDSTTCVGGCAVRISICSKASTTGSTAHGTGQTTNLWGALASRLGVSLSVRRVERTKHAFHEVHDHPVTNAVSSKGETHLKEQLRYHRARLSDTTSLG